MEEIRAIKRFSKKQKEEVVMLACKEFNLQVRNNSENNFLVTLSEELLRNLDYNKMFVSFLLQGNIKEIKEYEDITNGKAFCEINI